MDERQQTGTANPPDVDPLATSDIGSDRESDGVPPVSGARQVLTGGMSSDADSVSAPELGGPARDSGGGDGSIGNGGGIDDGGTHGGGTAKLPDDDEVTDRRSGSARR